MSIRAQQIAELEEQLALHRQTEEAYQAWLKDTSTPFPFRPAPAKQQQLKQQWQQDSQSQLHQQG